MSFLSRHLALHLSSVICMSDVVVFSLVSHERQSRENLECLCRLQGRRREGPPAVCSRLGVDDSLHPHPGPVLLTANPVHDTVPLPHGLAARWVRGKTEMTQILSHFLQVCCSVSPRKVFHSLARSGKGKNTAGKPMQIGAGDACKLGKQPHPFDSTCQTVKHAASSTDDYSYWCAYGMLKKDAKIDMGHACFVTIWEHQRSIFWTGEWDTGIHHGNLLSFFMIKCHMFVYFIISFYKWCWTYKGIY